MVDYLPRSFHANQAPAIRRRPPASNGLLLRVDCGYVSDVSSRCAVAVPASATFADLVGVLERAYAFDGGHLSEITIPPVGTPRGGLTTDSGYPRQGGTRIWSVPGGDYRGVDLPDGALYADEEVVAEHLGVGWCAWWLYDFGDQHRFALRTLASVDAPDLAVLVEPAWVPIEDAGGWAGLRPRDDYSCYEEAR